MVAGLCGGRKPRPDRVAKTRVFIEGSLSTSTRRNHEHPLVLLYIPSTSLFQQAVGRFLIAPSIFPEPIVDFNYSGKKFKHVLCGCKWYRI